MISINRKRTQNLNYELNYWWHLYFFLFWIFIFVLLYSGMQEAKLYYSRIDKTNRLRYIASRFIFEFKHLNRIFLVLQTTLIFKFCLRIEITIHKLSSPGPKPLAPIPKNSKPRGLGLTLKSHRPPPPPPHDYQNASIQGRQIQCSKDQMQVSHVEKNMVEQSSTVPNSQSKWSAYHSLGLTLSTPGLVIINYAMHIWSLWIPLR